MYSYVSIWPTTDKWATHGGLVKTDWSKAPFVANYNLINLHGSVCQLSPMQLQQMRAVQRKYKVYDYCNFRGKPTECSLPQQ
jgi:xyloglucan:xyloglucosyl transferase